MLIIAEILPSDAKIAVRVPIVIPFCLCAKQDFTRAKGEEGREALVKKNHYGRSRPDPWNGDKDITTRRSHPTFVTFTKGWTPK